MTRAGERRAASEGQRTSGKRSGRLRQAGANVALTAGAALAGVLLAFVEGYGRDAEAAAAFLRREGLLVVALLVVCQVAAEVVRWLWRRDSGGVEGRDG